MFIVNNKADVSNVMLAVLAMLCLMLALSIEDQCAISLKLITNIMAQRAICSKFTIKLRKEVVTYIFKVNDKVGGTVCYMSTMKFVERYRMLYVQYSEPTTNLGEQWATCSNSLIKFVERVLSSKSKIQFVEQCVYVKMNAKANRSMYCLF